MVKMFKVLKIRLIILNLLLYFHDKDYKILKKIAAIPEMKGENHLKM